MYAIELTELTKKFKNRTAVDSLSFQINEGEIFSAGAERRRKNHHNTDAFLPLLSHLRRCESHGPQHSQQ